MGYVSNLLNQDSRRTARLILFIASLILIVLGLDILIEKPAVLLIHPILENFVGGGMVLTGAAQAATLVRPTEERISDIAGYAALVMFGFFIGFRIAAVLSVIGAGAFFPAAIYLSGLLLVVLVARVLYKVGG